jgi:hypothetical protein
LGRLGALQGLDNQQGEGDFMRAQIAHMQGDTQNQPLQGQMLQQQIQQLMHQNSPEQQQVQTDLQKSMMQRYDNLPDILQALSYSGDTEAIRYLLHKKGLLGADFGQHQISPEDEALKQGIMQHLQQKGAR